MPHATTAERRKDYGQSLSLMKTGDDWIAKALECLQQFINTRADDGEIFFNFEQFRIYALASGLEEPASINAWGALTRSAVFAKMCEGTERFVKAERPESHARMIRVWRAL
jgi:hypothetical protein